MGNIVCEKLGIKYPIIQGAMTLISDAPLVSAVSNAGGLGVLATGQDRVSTDRIAGEIRKTKELTDKPFAVNIAFESPIAEKIIDLVCEEGVKVVTTGGGNPAPYMEKFKAHGVMVIPVVASVKVAKKMQAAGADMIIAEEMESGGYIGKMSTMALIPAVVDAVDIPVIAAGGIADGRGMAAAFMLGASGVQMGTRFLAASESSLPYPCKEAIVRAEGADAVVAGERIGVKLKHRSLKNAAIDEIMAYEGSEGADQDQYRQLFLAARDKMVEGDAERAIIGMGQGAGLVRQIQPAGEIVAQLMQEFEMARRNFCEA